MKRGLQSDGRFIPIIATAVRGESPMLWSWPKTRLRSASDREDGAESGSEQSSTAYGLRSFGLWDTDAILVTGELDGLCGNLARLGPVQLFIYWTSPIPC